MRLHNLLKEAGLPLKASDCAVNDLNITEYLITNIDVFTPIHDDPYIMGKIAACNVTNDLFAMNAVHVTDYSAFLGVPKDIPDEFPIQMMKGQIDFLKSLGSDVHGGHTIINPWPLLGGSASAVVRKDQIIHKTGVKNGDVMLITKPLGIQVIMAAYRMLYQDPAYLEDLDLQMLQNQIDLAVRMMTTSNQAVSQTIHEGKFFSQIHAMTDITGFGLRGHGTEMLYETSFGIEIHHLPVIPLTPVLSDLFGYQLKEGNAAETAGAMFMAVDSETVKDFEQGLTDHRVWWSEIGKVTNRFQGFRMAKDMEIIQIDDF